MTRLLSTFNAFKSSRCRCYHCKGPVALPMVFCNVSSFVGIQMPPGLCYSRSSPRLYSHCAVLIKVSATTSTCPLAFLLYTGLWLSRRRTTSYFPCILSTHSMALVQLVSEEVQWVAMPKSITPVSKALRWAGTWFETSELVSQFSFPWPFYIELNTMGSGWPER